MGEDDQVRERGLVMKEYVEAKALLDTLLSRRRRIGEGLRELSMLLLAGKPAPEADWTLLADPQGVRQLLAEIEDAHSRVADRKFTLEGWGIKLAD